MKPTCKGCGAPATQSIVYSSGAVRPVCVECLPLDLTARVRSIAAGLTTDVVSRVVNVG
jgi:hypothetical protein